MTTSKDLVIGLDSSTTSCKAIIWDTAGNLIVEGRSSISLEQPYPSWHEQSAEAWWQASIEALQAVTSQVEKNRLAGLCISPQRETFVPVDAQGHPLRKAIVWMDQRSGPLLPKIAQRIDPKRTHQQTGKPLSGNLALPKIAWLKENESDIFARTYKYLDVAAYLNHCLTGVYATGWGCADPLGLFDMQHNCWSAEILAFLEIAPSQLPEVFPVGMVLGQVIARAAKLTGLPPGLPVVAGVGDGQAAGLGANIVAPGQAFVNLGTAVVSGTYTDTFCVDTAYRTMVGAVPGSYSLETVLLGGTYTITWFVEKMIKSLGSDAWPNVSIEEMFDQAAQNISPGADGLMLVPYWNSAMNPYWDAAASGLVVGWRGFHTLEHLYRAILEGIGFELRLHLQGVQAALEMDIEKLVAMGGGTRSSLWCQIIANITGKPVYVCQTPDASALGAAMQAACGVGLFANMPSAASAMSRINPTPFLPDRTLFDFYTQLYRQVYRHLFPALQPYLANLTGLNEEHEHTHAEKDDI